MVAAEVMRPGQIWVYLEVECFSVDWMGEVRANSESRMATSFAVSRSSLVRYVRSYVLTYVLDSSQFKRHARHLSGEIRWDRS